MTNIIQVNTPKGRLYETPVGLLPSVTTILKATMPIQQQKRLGKSSLSGAASRGTKIHELIAAQLRGQLQDCPDELLEFWQPVHKIVTAVANPIAIELAVYHPTLKYAGTLDLIASWQNRLTIFDWKTSSRVKRLEEMEEAAIQVTAYKAAFEQLFGIEVEQAAIGVISPNRVQLLEVDIAQSWHTWLQRLEAYYASL